MNRNQLSIALALAVAVTGLASVACQPGRETNSTLTTNRNSTIEPVDTASVEAEINKIERDWSAAAKAKDVDTIRRILADDIVLTYPDGSTGTKADEVQLVETGAITSDSWDMFDTKVTVLDADAAFITGRAVIKNGKLKDPKSQQTIDITGEYRFLDVFAKRNGRWQAVASHVTKVQAPPAATPQK
ncbi:MAG TPA: nuclear transport factor 2 family protein [Pyrinomonadaceae bacterium]|nr:nuclear transport factor 2 family protein [Pyrinomonadaceae bacterium]